MANITNEEKLAKKPTAKDSKEIKELLKSNFGEEASYNKVENTIYLCNNKILLEKEFILLMSRFKFFIQPSLI